MNSDIHRKTIRLQGLSFREELDGERVDFEGRLVYLSVIPWEMCNWDSCEYCHETARFREKGELTLPETLLILDEASDLGIKSLLLLGGEVLMASVWERTQAIVRRAFENGLITVVYSNGSQLTTEMAEWLADHNVSVALKLDSLVEKKYDTLTGQDGSFRQTMRAIEIVKRTSIGEVVYENEQEKLVRLLLTTVGNAMNVDEYVSLARFATEQGARWMMEYLNYRGNAALCPELALDEETHNRAMRLAMALNPEQRHTFNEPCRLLSCITIRKRGEIAVCPQDYSFQGNIRELNSLTDAANIILARVSESEWRENWTGVCPLKAAYMATPVLV